MPLLGFKIISSIRLSLTETMGRAKWKPMTYLMTCVSGAES